MASNTNPKVYLSCKCAGIITLTAAPSMANETSQQYTTLGAPILNADPAGLKKRAAQQPMLQSALLRHQHLQEVR